MLIMAKPLSLNPGDLGFYNQTAEQLARRLPGEILQSRAGRHVIQMAEAFNGLVREGMESDLKRRKKREPGQICVTNYRGWPQLNVLGLTTSNKPQLTWLNELGKGEDTLTNAGLVRAIAEVEGETLRTPQEIFDYSVDTLDGKNLQSPRSPLKIVENTEVPFEERHIAFLRHAGNAKNSAGVAVLTRHIEPIASRQQLESVLDEIARELRVDPKKLREPEFLITAVKKSSRLRSIIEQLSNDDE